MHIQSNIHLILEIKVKIIFVKRKIVKIINTKVDLNIFRRSFEQEAAKTKVKVYNTAW